MEVKGQPKGAHAVSYEINGEKLKLCFPIIGLASPEEAQSARRL